MNLVDMLKSQIGGAVAGQIGKSLGIDEKTVATGIGAAIPTILGGLLKQASSPGGADQLNKTLDKDDFDGSIFDKLSDVLTNGKSGGLTNLGGSLSSMIFGDKGSVISSVLGKLMGLDSSKAGSLLAMILPLIMSFLGKTKRSNSLDASGFTKLLMSQKDNIASAMPKGMAETLGIGNLLSGGASVRQSRPTQQQSSGGSSGILKFIIPLAILAGLGIFLFKYLNQPPTKTEPNTNLPNLVNNDEPELPTEIAGVGDIFKDLTTLLAGIKDEVTAQGAFSKLTEVNDQLGGFAEGFKKLPALVRTAAAPKMASLFKPIQEMIDKVMEIPGASAILKPIVDKLMGNIKSLIGQ